MEAVLVDSSHEEIELTAKILEGKRAGEEGVIFAEVIWPELKPGEYVFTVRLFVPATGAEALASRVVNVAEAVRLP